MARFFCRREALKSAVRAICRFSWRIGKFKVFTVLKSCMENYGERGSHPSGRKAEGAYVGFRPIKGAENRETVV